MDVVCIIGDRVYHAAGSQCQKALEGRGMVLAITDAQAEEVGMEPCGFCIPPPGQPATLQKG